MIPAHTVYLKRQWKVAELMGHRYEPSTSNRGASARWHFRQAGPPTPGLITGLVRNNSNF
jgi:hypothetical protein